MRTISITLVASALILTAQTPGKGRGGVPLITTRPADSRSIQGAATGLMGWRVGLSGNAFRDLTFSEAAAKVDAAGLGFIEGSSGQKVSAAIPKNLDYNLSADEIEAVRHRLAELRLRMAAYHTAIPADAGSRRKLFEFGKALGVETIVAASGAGSLPELDQLAGEYGVNIAVQSTKGIDSLSKRIGVRTSSGQPLTSLKDRLLVVTVKERDPQRLSAFLLGLAKLDPPAAPAWPPKCVNCGAPTVPAKPVVVTLEDVPVPLFAKAALPAMGYRVNEIARQTPITSVDGIPAAERKAIEAGVPKQALAQPRKVRKLLIIDVCPNGGYYHATIAHANLALQLMAGTGAYEPIFSNDLANLKYPKIQQYDAVFLNSVVGELFNDPEVLGGLTRFVREGGGLAGIHGSTYASMDLPEFGDLIGAQDGPHQVEPSTLKVDDPNSPLTAQFNGQGLDRVDEFYHFLPSGPYSREKLHVLLSLDNSKTNSRLQDTRPDRDYGLAWIRTYGKGRVFNCAMGHTPTLFAEPKMAKLILAGIQFVLGDLAADATPSVKLAGK